MRTYCCSSEGPGASETASDGVTSYDASSSDPTSSEDARFSVSGDSLNDATSYHDTSSEARDSDPSLNYDSLNDGCSKDGF